MIFKIIRLMIQNTLPWLVIALISLALIGICVGASGSNALVAVYLIIYLSFIAISCIQFSLMPLVNGFFNIPSRSLAWFNQGMLLLFSLVGFVPIIIFRLLGREEVGVPLTDIATALLLSFMLGFMLLRFAVMSPFSFGGLFIFIMQMDKGISPQLIGFNRWAWPIYALLLILAIVEFPEFLKAGNKGSKNSQGMFVPCDIYGPKGPHPLIQLRGAVIWMAVLICVIPQLPGLPHELKIDRVFRVALLGIIVFLIYVFTTQRRAALASGLRSPKAILYTFTAIFGIGYCYRFSFGVRDGKPVRCLHCTNWCMIWMRQCPHCIGKLEEVRSILPATTLEAKAAALSRINIIQGDQLKAVYRIGILGILIFIWWSNFILHQ